MKPQLYFQLNPDFLKLKIAVMTPRLSTAINNASEIKIAKQATEVQFLWKQLLETLIAKMN